MRKILLLVTGLILSVSGFSQITADIGIWGGWSGYMGDIENNTLTQSSFPFLGAFYRMNFNPRVSARAMFLTGKIAAEGTIQNVAFSFDKQVQDMSVQLEVNYLRYTVGNKRYRFTSYITGGIGAMFYPYRMDPVLLNSINPSQNKGQDPVKEHILAPTLPFGFGFKMTLGKRLGLGVEYQMRKIFNDKLDDLDDPLAFIDSHGKEVTYTSFFHNGDWAGFLGVHLTYSFYLGGKECPAYDQKR
jgi:hypothetical protein